MKENRSFPERLLYGVSIIMTVFGIVEMVVFAVALAGLLVVNSATARVFSGTRDIADAGVFLAAALAELITGILGRKLVNKVGSRKACLIFGLLCLVLTAASLFLLGRPFDLLTVITLALSILLPAVYLAALLRIPAESLD